MQNNNENELLNKNDFTSTDYAKTLLSLQSATVTDGVAYLIKELGLPNSTIPSLTKYVSLVKGVGVSSAIAWDSNKSQEDNIAYLSGTLSQDLITTGITVVALGINAPALPSFFVGLLLAGTAGN